MEEFFEKFIGLKNYLEPIMSEVKAGDLVWIKDTGLEELSGYVSEIGRHHMQLREKVMPQGIWDNFINWFYSKHVEYEEIYDLKIIDQSYSRPIS